MFCIQTLRLTLGIRALLNMDYYAVAKGRNPGIYKSWGECEAQVKGFKQAKFKKFHSENEAKKFIYSAINIGAPAAGPSFITSSRSFQTEPLKKVQKKNNLTKSSINKPSRSNSAEFEDIHDIQDELLSKMNEIESALAAADSRTSKADKKKCKTCKIDIKTTKRKAIMIEPIQNGEPPIKKPFCTSDNTDSRTQNTSTDLTSNTNDFMIDDSGFVEVYTDGSCINNGSHSAKAGLGVYFGEGHRLNVSEPVSGRATNNCGEIQAATKAIQLAYSNKIKKLCIKTDSQFVINTMTKWISGWKKRGWKLSSGQPVKNEIDFKELDKATMLLEVKWTYVTAHKGILGNERADELAKSGAAMYKNKAS